MPAASNIGNTSRNRMVESPETERMVYPRWHGEATAGLAQRASGARQRHAELALVLAAAVLVRGLAFLVGLEEQHLRDALVRVDLRGQRRRVRELERDVAFPLGLERRHVDDDPAARVGALPEADREHVARDPEQLDRARERERVRRDDADLALEVYEAARVEVLRIDDRRVDVREDLELVGAAHVVAVAR